MSQKGGFMRNDLIMYIAGISLIAQVSFADTFPPNTFSTVALAKEPEPNQASARAAIADNPESIFTPAKFSLNLVKPAAFDADPRPRTGIVNLTGDHHWYLFMKQGQSDFTFAGKTGIAYPIATNTKLTFVDATAGVAVAEAVLPPDKVIRNYKVNLTPGKLYRIDVKDKAGFAIDWEPQFTMTHVNQELKKPSPFNDSYAAYFYVPKNTSVIGGYWKNIGARIIDPKGTVALTNTTENTYFSYPVPDGMDGKIWKLEQCANNCYLMTVPPEIARHPRELLLPKEVVKADKLN
ncbi:hypothetical protein [Nitrosovibrio sp. Nv4]|uniref:hypothetical protein n=1 Tax=Nitrosovibrio sp. Nv4 TaxID=1945880 RepID=UPI0011B1FBC0|nr:hypothetical protein [Nitrosovibrio sp. Nv4]